MDESHFNLAELTEAIRAFLAEAVPDLVWDKTLGTAVMPTVPAATVSADSIDFEDTVKGGDLASVTFIIYVVNPDVSKAVDEYAMRIRAALMEDETLGDLVQMSYTKKMTFGTAAGAGKTAGACAISFVTKLWL